MAATAAGQHRELELKFELDEGDFTRLRDAQPLGSHDLTDATRKTLRSVYFDTSEHHLAAAQITLRLRNDGASGWLQTVKAGDEPKGGVSDVAQLETSLDTFDVDLDRIEDKRLKRRVRKICKAADLKPVFETIIDRTAHVIAQGNCTAELALDEGRVEAGGRSSTIREVELELLSGSPHAFLAIAKDVFTDFRLRPGHSSKAARGYRLLRGEEQTNTPRHASTISLDAEQTAAEAFAVILQSAVEQITANQRCVIETGDVEAVHQMRVGLTRLRAALRSIKPYTKASWVRELETGAQAVARIVGKLRDIDVLIGEIYEPVAREEAANVPGFPELLDALKTNRSATYKEVVTNIEKGIWAPLLLTMALCPYLLETEAKFDQPVLTLAEESLERRWKRVRHYGQRIDFLDLEERHSMRKALKKLRYNCEFFRALYNDEAHNFIDRVKKLQELFGVINDARMAGSLMEIALDRRESDPKLLAAAGYLAGRHEAHVPLVWSNAKREWERLEKAASFWRL